MAFRAFEYFDKDFNSKLSATEVPSKISTAVMTISDKNTLDRFSKESSTLKK